MACKVQQPFTFTPGPMMTTSSRLNYLDMHFALPPTFPHDICPSRQSPSRSRSESHRPADHSSSIPIQHRKSESRMSTHFDATSFSTASSCPTNRRRSSEFARTAQKEKFPLISESSNDSSAEDTHVGQAMTNSEETQSPSTAPRAQSEAADNLSEDRAEKRPRRSSTPKKNTRSRQSSVTSDAVARTPATRRRSTVSYKKARTGEDLIAFHRESCKLMQTLDATLSRNSKTSSPTERRGSTASRPASQRTRSLSEHRRHYPASEHSTLVEIRASPASSILLSSTLVEAGELEKALTTTPICWNSAETRRSEYAKIDSAHTGIRGLWKKVTPKWCHGKNSRKNFFDGKCDGDSIRRFRVD